MSPDVYAENLRAAERDLSRADPLMRRLVRRHGPCRLVPERRRSPYEALVRAVVHQQLHGAAAGRILGRFVEAFPDAGFPGPHAVLAAGEEPLRAAGLSRQKTAAIRDIAAQAVSGVVPVRRGVIARAADEAIVERLTRVRGVGRWTVEMLLIFTLGRLDVLPVDDYGVRKGFSRAAGRDGLVTPRELREIGAAWAPWRSVAAWYCWRAAEDA